MAAIDQAYLSRHPYAVVIESATGNTMVFASFRERAVAEKLASGLVTQVKRAYVRIDRRLHELPESPAVASNAFAGD